MKRVALLSLAVPVSIVLLAAAPPSVAPKQSAELSASLGRASTPASVWVYFTDKGPESEAAGAPLTRRALARRALRATRSDLAAGDRSVHAAYVDAVRARVGRVRQVSRWLNAVSVEATAEQVRALEALPFVERLDAVRRYRRRPEERLDDGRVRSSSRSAAYRLDYGTSLAQLEQIRVPAVHDLGLTGDGVVIAVLDSGFDNLPHEVFATTKVIAQHDFVNGDPDVADGTDRGDGSHGTMTLSTLGGFKEGQLVGPAYNATFLLAKTEDTVNETPVEEDHWVAAAEWAEALGADVISSSLGYLEYDPPHASYTPADMNGVTAICTRAADLAVERGVVVVASAGNLGPSTLHNTLGAPADGRRVLAIGAVDLFGRRSGFSSVGPSADGRIKPDLAAAGSGVKVASSSSPRGYGFASGTSFSCPLTAGVVALVLQAHPEYTPEQVASVLRGTASQSAAPDNLLGWGIIDALAAIQARP